ncbi:MAG: ATP-binding cassette domain-containing protein [Clostridiales bacterium]|nr:ATP-binding cassette domain-containing protein [Clostridiales bacterium]
MAISLQLERELGRFSLNIALESQCPRIGILGASGCGKSMTLKSIAGVVSPDRGRIEVDGRLLYDSAQKIDLPPRSRQVGYLFQNYALFPTMTVAQNIASGLRLPKAQRQERVQALITQFRLEGLEGRYPAQLSGGQQQRVALARMMAPEPKTILLDEPFSALDQVLRDELQQELTDFLQTFSGQAILVSHRLEEVYHFCRELVVMEQGHILLRAPREEVLANPRRRQAARLTGCETILEAVPVGEHRLRLTGWDVELTTAQVVSPNASLVGIRPNGPIPAGGPGDNVVEVEVLREISRPFDLRTCLVPCGRPQATPILWNRLGGSPAPRWLYLPPEQVLPLEE